MKWKLGILSCLLVLLLVSAAYADSSSSSTSSSSTSSSSTSSSSTSTVDQAALVYVSNVSLDNGEYFPDDEGTLTVTLTNGGTSAIGLENPTLISPHISTPGSDWEGMSYVGAGSTISYSIPFTAKYPCGTYFALFTIGTQNGNAIHYPVKIKISTSTLTGAITSKPTSFAPEAEQNVTLTLLNTRSGDISNVVITPEGSGIDADPSVDLIPTITAGSSTAVDFGITPHQASDLLFNISYQVGDNTHYTSVDLPINIGQDKTAAVPIVNDVELTSSGSTQEITGDVTNAGISDAYGVTVTVGSPAVAIGTYPVYAIGSIASDDSGSFDITFTANDLSKVPLIVSWKDSTGNDYNITKTLDLGSGAGSTAGSGTSKTSTTSSGSYSSMSGGPGDMSGGPGGMGGGPGGSSSSSVTSLFSGSKGGGLSAFYPIIGAVIVLIVGIVLWKKRKWILAKLNKKQ